MSHECVSVRTPQRTDETIYFHPTKYNKGQSVSNAAWTTSTAAFANLSAKRMMLSLIFVMMRTAVFGGLGVVLYTVVRCPIQNPNCKAFPELHSYVFVDMFAMAVTCSLNFAYVVELICRVPVRWGSPRVKWGMIRI